MTPIEEKSLKAQIELYKEIAECDEYIIYAAQNVAAEVLNSIIINNSKITEDHKSVELSIEAFIAVKKVLEFLSSDDGFSRLHTVTGSKSFESKKEKKRILSMLQT